MKEEIQEIGLSEINGILSKALIDLSKRKISPKQAQVTSRIALALSKNIERADLKKRIESLEQMLKHRK